LIVEEKTKEAMSRVPCAMSKTKSKS